MTKYAVTPANNVATNLIDKITLASICALVAGSFGVAAGFALEQVRRRMFGERDANR